MQIAILSRGPNLYSTKRLAEAGEAKGHKMRIIDILDCYVMVEKGKPTLHYNGQSLRGIDAVIPRISSKRTFYGAAIVRQFETMGIFTTATSQAITRSRDKLRSLQILAKAGVDLPKTIFTANPQKVDEMFDEVGGVPLVIKLLEGTQGIGVMLGETIKSAKSIVEGFHGVKANVLIQEFIKEAEATDIRAFLVDGKVVGAMKRQGAKGEFRSNLHRGGEGVLIKLSRKEKNTAVKAAKALGLSVAGVDMLPSKRGPLLMEVNSSPGLEGIETSTKIDIASEIISYIERNVNGRKKQKDKVGI